MGRPDTTRRALLACLAASPAVMLGTRPLAAQQTAAAAAGLISSNVCLLATGTTAGPYYTDPGLVRSDITEGKDGVAMDMVIQVVDASCQPIAGARVDIWHCDALGNYSGYANQGSDRTLDTSAETFLRGTQMADEQGIVTFKSVYPGWYRGRTTHIHHKVFIDETNVLTGQIFFPDALSQYLYDNVPPYNDRRAARETMNGNDRIAEEAGEGSYAAVREAGDRYVATLVIGVDPEA
jgi:protocatechuate 3,4-dioxygenase beta subunit